MSNVKGLLPKSPGGNINEFLVTILGEAKEEQFPLFEPTGRVWKLPEASLRMVKKSFQRPKGDLSNSPLNFKGRNRWKTGKTSSERESNSSGFQQYIEIIRFFSRWICVTSLME
jgi:hypothetical protein